MPNCPDANEENLGVSQTVIIVGTVTHVTPGNPCVASISFKQNGVTVNQDFEGPDLIKGEIDGNTITGALEIPT